MFLGESEKALANSTLFVKAHEENRGSNGAYYSIFFFTDNWAAYF